MNMTRNVAKGPSMGDKDLWHLAWLITKSPLEFSKYLGGWGHFGA